MPSTPPSRSTPSWNTPRLWRRVGLVALVVVWTPTSASAINRSWDDAGGSASKLWSDFGNWSPDGDPSNDDLFIGNLAGAANDTTLFDLDGQINSLTLSGGADVVNSTDAGATNANTREVIVNGDTTLSGAGTGLVVYGRPGDGFDTNTLSIGSGATVTLNSQAGVGTAVLEVDSGLLTVSSGGELVGNGRVDLEDASPGFAHNVVTNNGEITASHRGFTFLAPPVSTLQLTASSPDARFDWDGGGGGVLNANGNATLDIDVNTSGDAFSGTMNLATGSTIDVEHAWSLDSGVINANTPAFGLIIIGQDPNPGAAASLAGAGWTMTGGTINVDDSWDSLQFDSVVTATGGVIENSGTLIFNADASFGSGVDFNMSGLGASLTVNATVNIDTPDFNLDGGGSTENVTTINAGGNLDLDLGAGADENFNHTINLNGGELDVTTADNTWSLTSSGDINAAGGFTSTINGETLSVAGTINVAGDSTLRVNSRTEYESSANVVVDAGSTLNHGTTVYRGGSFTGGGVFKKGNATIELDTTWDVATIDIDDGTTLVEDGTALVINTDAVDDSGDGIDSTVTVEDQGELTFNLSGGGDVVFDSAGRLVYNGNNVSSTFVHAGAAGAALRFDSGSEFNVNGDGTVGARIKLNGGTLNINTAGEDLRMTGGTLAAGDTNEITGGTINGPGELQIASGTALRGHGVINAPVDADGTASLIAEGGQLDVNGGLVDVGTIGTEGAGSTLNVTDPWNTSVANRVLLQRGTLMGSTITNDGANGISGVGAVTARVVNNSVITATSGTLVVDNTATDWDGSGGTGTLGVSTGTLELRDNAAFLFTGTVDALSGTVYANGFELEFEPGSTLHLSKGTYRSTNATDIGGTVLVDGGASSRINVGGSAFFEAGSSTTLNGDLEVENLNTVIAVGANFAGPGELRNVNGSQLTLLDGSNVGVQLTNDGNLEIAGAVAGRGDVADFVQSNAGVWNVDLLGTGVGDFDRLVTTGIAEIGGELSLHLIGAYVPELGDAFTILSATGGVLSTFDTLETAGAALDAGLVWQANYEANSVQVEVVLRLPGDFNNDGSVDAADYTVYRDNLGMAVTLPGDPTPGMVTADDHAVWAANYGATAALAFSAASAVPEPTTAGLLLLGCLGLGLRRRREA